MPDLTIERLFGNPPLTGRLPTHLKFAPDGSYVAYLQAASDDRERLDLWRMDMESKETRCWLNARDLVNDDAIMSDAEKAERERRRLFSSGITTFQISPDGKRLLIPAGGTGYLFDVGSETLTAFTQEETRQTDFQFSPEGRFISYVRDNDLYYYDVEARTETAVTEDGSEWIASGIADFIAQEEMHRFEGHWWAADESRLAFTRTDTSTVAVSHRYEIDADAFNVIEQRYPYAGEANATVDLCVYELSGAGTTTLTYRHAADDYLARVRWAGDNLAVQVQSRDQQRLWLDFHQPGTGGYQTILEETSESWINLHDNLQPIDDGRFFWTSERDGSSQLYLYSNGEPDQLTEGPGRVNEVLHADAERVVFSGWREDPTEQHLYCLSLAGGGQQACSTEPGWHDFTVSADGRRVIDRWTSLGNMGEIQIRTINPTEGESKHLAAEDTDPEHPYRPYLGNHVTPVLGTLTAEDGQTLHYRLTEPRETSGTHPLVVYVYGGPGVNRVRNEWAPLLLQLFSSRGFGVLELDNRGSANRSREFEAPIYRRLGRAEVNDQVVGARFAQSLPWVDASRIGVFGHSYGGYMTLMCLAQAPEVFQAGVAVAPVSEWELYDTHYTERYLSTPQDNPEGYRESAVFPYLDKLSGKLLIMHGMADDNVLFTHSTRLFKALQSQGTPFEMMTYPGSKHSLQEQDVSTHRFNMILDFFERSL